MFYAFKPDFQRKLFFYTEEEHIFCTYFFFATNKKIFTILDCMPAVEVWSCNLCVVLKRSMATGYSGVNNPLFVLENSRMLFGDAKDSLEKLHTLNNMDNFVILAHSLPIPPSSPTHITRLLAFFANVAVNPDYFIRQIYTLQKAFRIKHI